MRVFESQIPIVALLFVILSVVSPVCMADTMGFQELAGQN